MKSMDEDASIQEAVFAMGCFWCGETAFRAHETHKLLEGIKAIRVGYAGGTKSNPTYESHDGYKEAVKVSFNPGIITYDQLLDIFWHNIDFLDGGGQFADRGFPYTTAIFFKDETQGIKAEASKKALETQFQRTLKTEIIPFSTFYDAEEYHQNYRFKNPVRYDHYRGACGRDKRLKEIWGVFG